jgi:predicted nucleic acid-binding protein
MVANAVQSADIVVPDLVFLEVMYGFPTPAVAAKAEALFGTTESVSLGGAELARRALRNHWELRAKSVTVRSIADLLIGTWCLENRVPVLHFDRDYDQMEKHLGLKVFRIADPSPQLA